jgi:hypothetical protein
VGTERFSIRLYSTARRVIESDKVSKHTSLCRTRASISFRYSESKSGYG